MALSFKTMTNCKGVNPKTISILAVLLLGANTLTTATADPLQIIFTDQPNQIAIGSEVHLTCVVSGGNDPHVTWISPTGLLPVNSHITNGGRTLLITNYDVTDNGQYICVASDGQEFANHVFTLSAQHTETHPTATTSTTTTASPTTTAPTTTTTSATTHSATHAPGHPSVISIVVQPTNYHLGSDVHITCTVESNPPHTQLGWNMLTDPSHIPSNIHLDYGRNKVTLTIKRLTEANFGEYQCFVVNSLGQDIQFFSLHQPKQM